MVPEPPTPTNTIVALSALAVLDELLDEEQDMEMKLKRNTEKMMSICLIEFPISGLVEPNIYHQSDCFARKWGFYLEGD